MSNSAPTGDMRESPRVDVLPLSQTPLAQQTASGFAWAFAQTVASKGALFGMQIILAWFLSKDDFALIALATTVASLASMIQQIGLREILVQRQRRFGLWAAPAYWMAIGVGLFGFVFMCACAPIGGVIFHSRKLVGLTLVLAAGLPFTAVSVIPMARLQTQLHFRRIAWISLWTTVGSCVLTVLLAWLGFGAYSFAWPRSIAAAATLALLWKSAGLPWWYRLRWTRCKYLLTDSGFLAATSLFTYLLANGDYLALGLLRPKQVVGTYFFAFTLSTQTLSLVSSNLATVLYPTLSRMDVNPERQLHAMLRASRLLALIGIPLCLIQVVVARPAITLLYREKWVDAIPVFQILSVAMAFVIVSPAAASLIQAQRRFSFYFKWTAALGVLYFAFAGTGALLGGALSTSIAVAVFYGVFGPLGMYVAIRPAGAGWAQVWGSLARPLGVGALATAAGLMAVATRNSGSQQLLLRGCLGVAVFSVVYTAGALVCCRSCVEEVSRIAWALLATKLSRARS